MRPKCRLDPDAHIIDIGRAQNVAELTVVVNGVNNETAKRTGTVIHNRR
jgi:hypothetical protein